MGTHVHVENTVPQPKVQKPGHFDPGGSHYARSPKSQAVEVAGLPAHLLGTTLARCDTFLGYSVDVREGRHLASSLACRYTRSPAGKLVVERMLLTAAQIPPETPDRATHVETTLIFLGYRAAYVGSPLDPGDARYALQQVTLDRYWHGAQLVARRGAHRCLRCGATRARASYCGSHRLDARGKASDQDAARVVLRDAAEALGIVSSGKQARRIRTRR